MSIIVLPDISVTDPDPENAELFEHPDPDPKRAKLRKNCLSTLKGNETFLKNLFFVFFFPQFLIRIQEAKLFGSAYPIPLDKYENGL